MTAARKKKLSISGIAGSNKENMKGNGRSNGTGGGWSFGRWGSTKTASTNTTSNSVSTFLYFSFTVLVSSFLSCFPLHQNPNPFTCASHPLASLPDPPHRRLALLRQPSVKVNGSSCTLSKLGLGALPKSLKVLRGSVIRPEGPPEP
ncbi:hypothetical protein FOVG_05141 [Fusarium oxysporum f. sp. pisi HDV247]|uniref:Uncharacterized protein n=1 Tax=Fusarium oxysporum f. sp. pisi HDV247 TaxID=1080344 RepID=W9Q9E7_FUSOX|nr:hypothetical protein FOVG_05141 [Fusarium oxysporum f. sp. pisi HDV247]